MIYQIEWNAEERYVHVMRGQKPAGHPPMNAEVSTGPQFSVSTVEITNKTHNCTWNHLLLNMVNMLHLVNHTKPSAGFDIRQNKVFLPAHYVRINFTLWSNLYSYKMALKHGIIYLRAQRKNFSICFFFSMKKPISC